MVKNLKKSLGSGFKISRGPETRTRTARVNEDIVLQAATLAQQITDISTITEIQLKLSTGQEISLQDLVFVLKQGEEEILERCLKAVPLGFLSELETIMGEPEALELIHKNKIDFLAIYLSFFQNLSQKTAQRLIDAGKVDDLVHHLGRFVGLSTKFAQKLIKLGKLGEVVLHLDRFLDLNHQSLAQYIIDQRKIDGINIYILARHLENFRGLNQHIAEQLITLGEGTMVVRNLDSFVDLDYKKIIRQLIESGQDDALEEILNKFIGQSSDTNKEEVDDEKKLGRLIDPQKLKAEIDGRDDLSRGEKKRLLKVKIFEIRKEIAAREKLLTDFIRGCIGEIDKFAEFNPNYSPEEILKKIPIAPTFSPEEKAEIEAILKKTCQKNKAVAFYYENFKDYPKKLFKLLFKHRPKGRVTLEKKPFGLGFLLYDIEDYKQASSSKSIAEAICEGGCSLPSSEISALEGMLVLVNCSGIHEKIVDGVVTHVKGQPPSDDNIIRTLWHEQQHNIYRIIFTSISRDDFSAIKLPLLNKDTSIEDVHVYFSYLLRQSLKSAKDEIIAYMAGGTPSKEVISTLTRPGGLYDYWENEYFPFIDKEMLTRKSQISAEVRKFITKSKKRYRKLHNKVVKEAVYIGFKRGDMTELAVTPIRQWRQPA